MIGSLKGTKSGADYDALYQTHEALLIQKEAADAKILDLQGKLQHATSTITQLKEIKDDEFFSDEEDALSKLKEQYESLQYEIQVDTNILLLHY